MSYTTQFPPAYNSTYINADYLVDGKYDAWFAVDPSKTVTGVWDYNMWYNLGATAKYNIDLGAGYIIRRVYYEPNHYNGSNTIYSVRAFTFWGSNDVNAFNSLTYADQTGWTQLTTDVSEMAQHVAADQADPHYIVVDNSTSYQYYGFKTSTTWGGANAGLRRIQLQLEDGYGGGGGATVIPGQFLTPSSKYW